MGSEEWVVKRQEEADEKANRWKNGLAMLATGHHSQRVFMKASLESLQGLRGWLLLAYDNPGSKHDCEMPGEKHYEMIDQFVMKHVTEIPGPTYPQFWNYRYGMDLFEGRSNDYIFSIGTDSVLEKPEGLNKIIELLGDWDIVACSSSNPKKHQAAFCGTKSFLVKKEAFKVMIDYIEKTFVPFKSIGNMENRFGMAIKDLNIKEVVVPEMPSDDQFAHEYDEEDNCIKRGTWGEILGYRHLGGEHKIRRLQKRKPIEEKYFDKEYLSDKEKATLLRYWETNDEEYLKRWWET